MMLSVKNELTIDGFKNKIAEKKGNALYSYSINYSLNSLQILLKIKDFRSTGNSVAMEDAPL